MEPEVATLMPFPAMRTFPATRISCGFGVYVERGSRQASRWPKPEVATDRVSDFGAGLGPHVAASEACQLDAVAVWIAQEVALLTACPKGSSSPMRSRAMWATKRAAPG
jgi:hypothetical protein